MKWIMGVSLGSPSRDHSVEFDASGERVIVERRGTGGDILKAERLIRDYDGRVDAFGLGGVNFHYLAGRSMMPVGEAARLSRAARISPLADGGHVKRHIEPSIIDALESYGVQFRGKRALVSSALDRWHLAVAIEKAGCKVGVCDAATALRLPVIFPSTRAFECVALVALPGLRLLPLRWLYPSGEGDGGKIVRALLRRAIEGADVYAGDSYLLGRILPRRLDGKTLVLSTATDREFVEFKRRGAGVVASTSPSLAGRSFGANIIEAIIVAVDGRRPEEIPAVAYRERWHDLGFGFRIELAASSPAS